jgi:hypothetical protein
MIARDLDSLIAPAGRLVALKYVVVRHADRVVEVVQGPLVLARHNRLNQHLAAKLCTAICWGVSFRESCWGNTAGEVLQQIVVERFGS